ncbi:hypothetical protein DL96DRAFT_928458 [Flagelloscypha sp. PMI_526]|nr:hypothetical protein DL96DRAFT_928458 [Flagelloscypha sp. PMI_526]
MCSAYSIGSGYWAWDWGVSNYGNMAAMAISPVTYPVDLAWIGTVPTVVQFFFAWRIWVLSHKRNYILPLLILALSLAGYGIAIWIIYMLAIHRPLAELTVTLPTAYFWLACTGAADILITGSMFWYLEGRFKRSGAEMLLDRDSRFRRIVFRTVEANVLSLVAQALALALFSIPNIGLYFLVGDALLGPVYSFSLIVSLLGRTASSDSSDTSRNGAVNSFVLSNRRGETIVSSNRPKMEIAVSHEVDTVSGNEWKPHTFGSPA